MKIKCDWCGGWINDFDQTCPNCGGVNQNYKRQADGTPRTIEELRIWAKENHLPLEEMRTFIGEDYKGAKAFGIYKDETDNTFVVYKNKADGSRAVRYKGSDEAYAVNELYQKMKERVAEQKAHQAPKSAPQMSQPSSSKVKKTFKNKIFYIAVAMLLLFDLVNTIHPFWGLSDGPDTGYYTYGDQNYYYYYGDWYEWDDDQWAATSQKSWMKNDYEDYYDSRDYDSNAQYSDFRDSDYYTSYSDYSNDSDDSWNDDSWDSGWDSDDSWDSGWDDWDSDW